ncbi:hypothetical protein B0G81_3840 [Paraburkholderia sp. BL6665CI2N2]|nr:hypothetical protein B0G81_3840 [Paraburkholderia sp. BL6665CI2N2]
MSAPAGASRCEGCRRDGHFALTLREGLTREWRRGYMDRAGEVRPILEREESQSVVGATGILFWTRSFQRTLMNFDFGMDTRSAEVGPTSAVGRLIM